MNGVDAIKTYIEAVRMAFPDVRFEVLDLIAENDRVTVRWSFEGTQTGVFRGNAPTGRSVEFPGITMFRFFGGKIQEMWIYFDPGLLLGDD